MDSRTLYNLSISEQREERSQARIGLLRKRTGIPVFLIFLKGVDRPSSRFFSSYEGIVAEMERAHLPWDKEAWRSVLPFFFAEGREAYVSLSPISSKPNDLRTALVGKDGGLKRRTGLYSLKSFADTADLVCVPQASQLLALADLVSFYESIHKIISPLEHFFCVLDLPCGVIESEARGALEPLCIPDASVFHPWIALDGRFSTPGPLVCAHIQQVDEAEGLQFIPANRKLSANFRPVCSYLPTELQQFNRSRINILHTFSPHDARIWGGRTLAANSDTSSRFIANRRLLLALKEAIEEICMPFVMEPLTLNLPHIAEVQLLSVLAGLEHLFDPDAKQPYRLSVAKREENGEDILTINFTYSIPYAVDEVYFSLGLTG